jgi:hypothetical protein
MHTGNGKAYNHQKSEPFSRKVVTLITRVYFTTIFTGRVQMMVLPCTSAQVAE